MRTCVPSGFFCILMTLQRCCLYLSFCLALAGCDPFLANNIDPAGNLTRKDYLFLRHRGDAAKDKEAPSDTDPEKTESPEPPTAAPEATPPAPAPAAPVQKAPEASANALSDKHVSLTVTEGTPLRDVLLELARGAHVNMQIDPRITGSLIFTAADQPFRDVLKQLCDQANLRIRQNGAFIKVELDTPYVKSYPVDFPSFTRRTSSEVSIATNVFDADVTSGGGGNSTTGSRSGSTSNNNSTAKIAGQSDTDFWADLDKSLTRLLAANKSQPLMITEASKSRDSRQQELFEASYTIDKQAGLVTVTGTDKQQRAVDNYLKRLRDKAMAQVLIEARIVEVELTDGFQSGINWQAVFSKSGPAATMGLAAGGAAASATNGLFTTSIKGSDFSTLLNLVRTFGATRILSSPRLTVLNNQNAVLKVAKNEVYFITSAQYSTTVNASGVAVSGSPVFTSTPHTVPVGLIMTVQPAIDTDRGLITMTLRPTISRIVNYVTDPSIGLNAAQAGLTSSVSSQIPVLAVREMDSVLQVHSGEVVVMGGLMQDKSENTDQGVPPFDNWGLLGNLFKSRDNSATTSELVILLRATVLDRPIPDAADVDLYQRYNNDPRPLPLSSSQLGD